MCTFARRSRSSTRICGSSTASACPASHRRFRRAMSPVSSDARSSGRPRSSRTARTISSAVSRSPTGSIVTESTSVGGPSVITKAIRSPCRPGVTTVSIAVSRNPRCQYTPRSFTMSRSSSPGSRWWWRTRKGVRAKKQTGRRKGRRQYVDFVLSTSCSWSSGTAVTPRKSTSLISGNLAPPAAWPSSSLVPPSTTSAARTAATRARGWRHVARGRRVGVLGSPASRGDMVALVYSPTVPPAD